MSHACRHQGFLIIIIIIIVILKMLCELKKKHQPSRVDNWLAGGWEDGWMDGWMGLRDKQKAGGAAERQL